MPLRVLGLGPHRGRWGDPQPLSSLPRGWGGVGDQDARPRVRGPAPPSPARRVMDRCLQRPDGGAGGAGRLTDPLELKQLHAWLRGGGRRT